MFNFNAKLIPNRAAYTITVEDNGHKTVLGEVYRVGSLWLVKVEKKFQEQDGDDFAGLDTYIAREIRGNHHKTLSLVLQGVRRGYEAQARDRRALADMENGQERYIEKMNDAWASQQTEIDARYGQ